MHDESYLNDAIKNGVAYYKSAANNIIFDDLTTGCYIYKCIVKDCGVQSSQSCLGKVKDNVSFPDLEEISKAEFEARCSFNTKIVRLSLS